MFSTSDFFLGDSKRPIEDFSISRSQCKNQVLSQITIFIRNKIFRTNLLRNLNFHTKTVHDTRASCCNQGNKGNNFKLNISLTKSYLILYNIVTCRVINKAGSSSDDWVYYQMVTQSLINYTYTIAIQFYL
jgi:hypothetical protein